jgi:hypothetical protein
MRHGYALASCLAEPAAPPDDATVSPKPNLILGVCVGYDVEPAEVFIRSFNQNVHSADVHLFTKDIRPSLAAPLRESDVPNRC